MTLPSSHRGFSARDILACAMAKHSGKLGHGYLLRSPHNHHTPLGQQALHKITGPVTPASRNQDVTRRDSVRHSTRRVPFGVNLLQFVTLAVQIRIADRAKKDPEAAMCSVHVLAMGSVRCPCPRVAKLCCAFCGVSQRHSAWLSARWATQPLACLPASSHRTGLRTAVCSSLYLLGDRTLLHHI